MTLITLLWLYIAFRLKQLTCDFLLQTDWMAMTKGLTGKEGWKALLSHSGIHAFGTLVVVVIFAPALWYLALIDFMVHSTVDRIKARITDIKSWSPKDTAFWWALGVDQEAHNFTHLAYIIWIALAAGLVL